MDVPSYNAQNIVNSWKMEDIPPRLVVFQVDGVPYTV
jgi:hypothetical protein